MASIEGSVTGVLGSAWIFATGRDYVIALPPATDAAVLAAIAALPRHAITIERLVATVPLLGSRAVESFAAVVAGASVDGDGVPISVVVRGGVAVQIHSVGGSRRFTDRDIRPWLLADFQAVTGLSIASTDDPAPTFAELGTGGQLATGADVGGRLDWILGTSGEVPRVVTVAPSGAASSSTPRSSEAHDNRLRTRGDVEDTALRAERGVEDTVLRAERRVDDTVLRGVAEDTVVRHQTGRAGGGTDDHTVGMARASTPPTSKSADADARQAEVGDVEVGDVDADADEPEVTSRFAFRIGNGQARALDAVYLIGRKPRYTRVAPVSTDVRLIAVPSPTNEVSSTHLDLRSQGSAIVVTDLRSTNGTVVHPARGRRVRLRPGESLVVAPGARVDIGDGTIIEVFVQTGAPNPASAAIPAPEPPTRRPTT